MHGGPVGDWEPRRYSSPVDSWRPAAPDAAQGFTSAKKVAKVSVIGDTAGEKKSLAADPQVLTIPPLEQGQVRPAKCLLDFS